MTGLLIWGCAALALGGLVDALIRRAGGRA